MLLMAVTVFILWTHAAMAKGLPYVPDSDDTVLNSEKMVFAHYVWPHPISLDNKACPNDYYNVNYVAYPGEGGVHKFSATRAGHALYDRHASECLSFPGRQ